MSESNQNVLSQNPQQNPSSQISSNNINNSNTQKNNINAGNQNTTQTQMNNPQQNPNTSEESKKANEEKLKLEYEMSIEYENSLRQQIEMSSPLVSDELSIIVLMDDYKFNSEYANSVKQITDKYKHIKKVRRDGNCFYRSFIFRLFEYICIKNNKNLYEHICKKIKDSKDLIERNGYDWSFIQDFYNIFYK